MTGKKKGPKVKGSTLGIRCTWCPHAGSSTGGQQFIYQLQACTGPLGNESVRARTTWLMNLQPNDMPGTPSHRLYTLCSLRLTPYTKLCDGKGQNAPVLVPLPHRSSYSGKIVHLFTQSLYTLIFM